MSQAEPTKKRSVWVLTLWRESDLKEVAESVRLQPTTTTLKSGPESNDAELGSEEMAEHQLQQQQQQRFQD